MSELAKKLSSRKKRWAIVLLAFLFILPLLYYRSYALVQTWDLATDTDYWCEGTSTACPSTNIEVTGGYAQLRFKTPDYDDDTQGEFGCTGGGGGDECSNSSGEGIAIWDTSHVGIQPYTVGNETVPINATVLRQPSDHTDWTNEIVMVHFDSDESLSSEQIFLDVAEASFAGAVYSDDISRGNNGTASEGDDPTVISSSAGPGFEEALQFDGGDQADLDYSGSSTSFAVNTTFDTGWGARSVGVWFKTPDVDTRQILYKEGGWVNGAGIYINEGKIHGSIWNGSGNQSNEMLMVVDAKIKTDTWHHFLYVHDSGASNNNCNDGHFRGYLDGELIEDANCTEFTAGSIEDQLNHSGNDSICRNDGDYFFNGGQHAADDWCVNGFIMDDYVVWNEVLTASDAQGLYGVDDPWLVMWRMEEASANVTDSGNWGHGSTSFSGTLTYSQTGQTGNAITFGGNAYFEIASIESLEFRDKITTMAWINPSAGPGDGNNDWVFDLNASTDLKLGLRGSGGGTYAYCELNDGGVTGYIGKSTISNGSWTHIACTFDAGSVRIYVDGVLDAIYVHSTTFDKESGNVQFRVGCDNGGTDCFNGTIDDAIYMKRAATPEEIAEAAGAHPRIAIMESGIKNAGTSTAWRRMTWDEDVRYGDDIDTTESNLVHLWHFDETDDLDTTLDPEVGTPTMNTLGTTKITVGPFGNARYFDENASILQSSASIAAMTDYTFEFWVRFEQDLPLANETIMNVLGRDPAMKRNTNGYIEVIIDNDEVTPEITSSFPITDRRWHHMGITNNAGALTLYIDGVNAGTGTGTASAAGDFYLGDDGGVPTDPFDGAIDEVAIYDTALSALVFAERYARGANQLKLLVRSCDDAACSGETWLGPDGNTMLTAPTSGANHVALWLFDETSYDGTLAEVVDQTSNNNDGRSFYAPSVQGGLFGRAVSVNGKSAYIRVPDTSTLEVDAQADDLTIEAWLYMDEGQEDDSIVVAKHYGDTDGTGTATNMSYGMGITEDGRLRMYIGDDDETVAITSTTPGKITVGEWVHVVAEFDGAFVNFYINGVADGVTSLSKLINYDFGDFYIGYDPTDTYPGFKGRIDSLAIYDAALGEASSLANYNAGKPDNYYSDGQGQNLNVIDNQYFQYKAFFYSEGERDVELRDVGILNNFYATTDPAIETRSASRLEYVDLAAFTETLGPDNAGSMRYVIQEEADGNWKYWNGSNWVNSDSTWAQANDAATINTNIAQFDDDVSCSDPCYVLWKGLMRSDGVQQVQLDTITIDAPNKVTVTAPESATLTVATTTDVTWTYLGDVTNVDIAWTINGAQYTDVALGVSSEAATGGCVDPGTRAGCYRMTVPDAIDIDFQVRVRETGDDNVTDNSDNNTVQGAMAFDSPNGGETFIVDDTMEIKWIASGSIDNIDDTTILIDTQYTGSNFTNPGLTTITTSARNDNNGFPCVPPVAQNFQYSGCYNFTVPDEITAQADARVRVTDGSHTVESAASFTITGSLALQTPIASNVWKVETADDINDNTLEVSWTYAGSIGTLDLQLDDTGAFTGNERTVKSSVVRNTDNGTGCTVPSGGGCVILASGEWPENDETTSGAATAKFRLVTDGGTPDPTVETVLGSTAAFEIRGWYDITTPVSNTTWLVGETTRNVVWDTHGDNLGNIDIHYSVDSLSNWIAIATNVSNSVADFDGHTYPWPTIPDVSCTGPPSGCDKMRIRIQQTGGGYEDISDTFTIKPTVNITDPVSKDFEIGSTDRSVAWTLSGTVPGNVNIYYSTDQNWENACVTSTGTGKCSVCSALSTALSCTWNGVPDTPSETVGFRAESADDPTDVFSVTTTTDNVIHGKFSVDTPPCAPNCYSEDEAILTWSETTGSVNIPTVDIYWSVDGSSWTKINSSATPNDGLFNSSDSGDGGPFIVPEAVIHDNLQIRVTDAAQAAFHAAGISSAFSSPVKLRVINPNGGEALTVGTTYDIHWGYQGQLSNTGIELSYCNDSDTCASPTIIADNLHPQTSNGTACSVMLLPAPESAGCYRWTDGATFGVANLRDIDFRIRVEDNDVTGAVADCTPSDCNSARPDVADVSDADFKIKPDLIVTYPTASGLQLDAQTAYTVQWTSQGNGLGNVDVLYSPNGGLSYPFDVPDGGNPVTNLSGNGATANSVGFTTPVFVSTGSITFKVKVQDPDTTNYADAADDSDNIFHVVARFDPTAPTGGESWPVLTNQTISWNSFGAISTVQVQYRSNSVANWTTIIQDTPTQGETDTEADGDVGNAGTFTWKVPNIANSIDNNGTEFRIIDAVDGHVLRTTQPNSTAINVVANLQVLEPPETGVNWRNNQTRVIRWKQVGHNDTISNVAIEYDATSSAFGNAVVIDANANNGINADNGGCTLDGGLESHEVEGCYAWTISGFSADDTSVWIRVRDIDSGNPASENASGNGVSSQVTILEGSTLTVQAPAAQTYSIDDNVDIIWSGTGDISTDTSETIDIYYATENPPSYPTDYTLWSSGVDADSDTGGCSSGGNLGCVRLQAPDAISSTFSFYIVDSDDADVNASSATNTINGNISINSPVPGPAATETYVVGDTMTVTWTTFGGTIGLANDTRIEIDTAYAEGAYGAGASGHTVITSSATNDNNGFSCVPPVVTAPQYGGCYEFTVPDELTTVAPGGDARVRVTENPSGFAYSSESQDFVVTGRLTLTKPTGTDVWLAESANDASNNSIFVGWDYQSANMGNLTLEFDPTGAFTGGETIVRNNNLIYNTNNGTSCTPSGSGGCIVLSGGELPGADDLTGGATTAKFRLTAAAPDPNVVSTLGSTPAFEVRGWYDVTMPLSNTTWSVGAGETITWDTHGNGLGNIDVQYKIDAGSWTDIATDIDNTNSYAWSSVVDAACSPLPLGCDKVKIRIRQTGGAGLNINDESDNFTVKPGLNIVDPSPLNFQIADTTREISWTVGGTIFSSANVYYSTDGLWNNSCQSSTGAGKCSVCSALAVATKCSWSSVPDTPSETVLFRVEAAEDTDINSVTSTNASIHGAFTMNLPACAPNCSSEEETNLTWTENTGSVNIANVDLYYYDGAAWQQINAAPTPNDGIFNSGDSDANAPWQIPEGLVSDAVQVRVVDVNDTLLNSAGDSAAFDTPVEFRIIEPNGGEELVVGTTFDIEWGYLGSLTNMSLLYCTDGTITCGAPGTISSNVVPNTNNGTGCTVPSGGDLQTDETGGCYRWTDATSTGVADIRGTQIRVFASDNDTACTPSACSSARPEVDDGSDADVKVQADLGIVQPTAASLKIDAATSYNVQWDSQGTPLSNVEIHYSNNGGSSYDNLFYSGANLSNSVPPVSPNNTYSWTTPNTISTAAIKYRVRVRDPDTTNYANVLTNSANDFDIVARFDPTAPAGGESWPAYTNQTLTWTTAGTVSQVRIEYYNNAIANWTTIIQDPAIDDETDTAADGTIGNGGTFIWKVPNVANIIDNNTTKIRLVDAVSGHILRDTPVESSTFNVVANLAVLEPPQSGVTWRATQTRVIRWKQIGDNDNLTNVTLEYDATDNTFSSPTVIASGINHGTNSDNGGCTLNGGLQAHETEGCFAWVIPGALSNDTTVWVRVKDNEAGHPDSTAVSGNGVSSSFAVYPNSTLNVEAPLIQTYDVDDNVDVQWSGTGAITEAGETVDIYYTTVGSPTYPADWTLWSSGVDADAATGGCSITHLGCTRLTAPDAISSTFKVRVEDADDSDIFNEGTDNTINGRVDIQSPAPPSASETYVVGDTMEIKWVSFGTMGNTDDTQIVIDSDYSNGNFLAPGLTTITTTAENNNNGFSCVPPVVSAPQFGGCYEFTIPDEITNAANARVRVTEGGNDSDSDDFTITGSVTLTKPTALDVWKTLTALDISDNPIYVEWTYTGTLGTLNLDFDPTGDFTGVDLRSDIKTGIVANTNNGTSCVAPGGGGCVVLTTGEYPDEDDLTSGATTAKFRLRATTPNPDVETNVGASPAFEVRGWYDVTAPLTNDTWLVQETTRDITWDTYGNGLGNVTLSYKVDTGAWIDIITNLTDSAHGSHTYTWPSIPDATCSGAALGCDKVKVRVMQSSGSILDESDNFTIKPRINITDPSPTNFQIADTTRTIAWGLNGTVSGNVNVYYSTDQNWGNSCVASTGTGKCSVCSATAASLSCTWASVPDTPSETVRFRAEAADDSTVNSTTTVNSSIHGSFTANLPACAPNCFSEDTTNLTWSEDTGSTNIVNVDIYYRVANGVWTKINALPTPNDGIFNSADTDTNAPFIIPEAIVHDSVQIRVVDTNDSLLDSAGDSASFSVPARLRMVTPNGAEVWKIGESREIQWTHTGTVGNVSIQYCQDGTTSCGVPDVISASVAANNSAGCTPPTPGTNETAGCYAWADATTSGVANTRGTQIRMFVSDEDTACGPAACSSSRPKVDDAADADMKITVSLAMAAPLANAQLDAATLYDIDWNSQGTPLTTVDLLLSDNGGSSYGTVIQLAEPNTSVANTTTLNSKDTQWTSPNLLTDTGLGRDYYIQVRDPDTTDYAEAVSNVNFDVVAKFTITNPTAASNFLVGRNYTLSWTTLGAVNNIQLAYDTPSIGNYTVITQTGSEGGTPVPTATDGNNEAFNTGTFTWQVPDVSGIISTGAVLRIIDGDDNHILRTTPDTSATFDILPAFEVLNPAGSEILDAGDTLNIQWKTLATNSAPTNVDIEFSTNGGSTWTGTVVTDATNGQNSSCTLPSVSGGETAACYEWKMPATSIGGNIKVRIKDSDVGAPDSTQDSTNGVSEAFQIQEAILIVQPATSDQITVGVDYDIQWEVYGTFANVSIQYSDDDFASDVTNIDMNSGHAANGSCTLSTPAAGGTAGCFEWNPVPNDVRPNLKMRLTEISGSLREETTGIWEIVGPLAIVSPQGGVSAAYDVDDIVTIEWSNNLGLPLETPIDLEYSTNGGGAWNQVLNNGGSPAEAIVNSGTGGTFDWEVPDTISDDVLVRVIRNNTSTVGDESNDNFDITGEIDLTILTSAVDQYAIGDTVPVTFNVNGTQNGSLFNAVTVRYSTDSTFQTGVVVAQTGFDLDHNGATTNCTGGGACTFNWTVADTHQIVGSEVYYLQVVDANQLIGASTSANQFQLYGDLTLSAEHPCGVDNTCYIGESPNIVFTKEGNSNGSLFDFVDIQYSDDGFANNIVTIESNWALDATNCPAGTCTYTWNIDNTNVISSGQTYYLRVIDPDNTISVDTGTTGFKIAGNLTLSTLSGGGNQIYRVGETVAIDFTKAGNANGNLFNDVVIQYSDQSDFSSNVVNIDSAFALDATNCPANACTKNWLIDDSNNISATAVYYLRVFDPDNTDSTTGASTDQFEIRGDLVLTILTAGNATYQVGDTVNINWEKDGAANGNLFNDVTIEYSDDGFANNTINIATVDLSAACSGSFPNETCTYAWVLDNSDPIITGQNYYLRVIDPQNADSVSTSTRQFKVAGDLTLTLLTGSDDTYDIGENLAITWTAEGAANGGVFDNVDVQYSNDNFSSNITNIVTDLGLSTACTGINCTYNWSIPSDAVITSTASYKFRVIDQDNPNDSVSVSTNRFRLAGYLNLTTQLSNTTYSVGDVVPITFDVDGDAQGTLFNDIHIQYSNNEFGGDTRDIALNQVLGSPILPFSCTATDCTYNWTIPNTVTLTSGFDYRLRVIDPDNTDLSTYGITLSAGKFKLSGGFTWNAPTGASVWGVGTDQSVDWDTSGNINNVKISYSTDDFANEVFFDVISTKLQATAVTSFGSASPITNTANGNTAFTMVVPDGISTNFKLRVYDSSDATSYRETAAFKVHAVYTMTEPGVNTKIANTLYSNGAQWTTAGTVANAMLQYQLDGGSWTAVPASESGSVTDNDGVMSGSPGSINWTTPSAKAAATKVRVCTANGTTPDTDTCAESSTFKLSAKVSVTAPNGENAPFWKAGETTRDITWTTIPSSLGNVDQVDILYSTQGLGGVFANIVVGTANDGTYTWNPIPDAVSDNVYVRIVDSSDSDGKDESDASFSIAGDLQIELSNGDAPLGGESWPVYKAIPAALANAQDIIWTSTGTAMNQVDIRASNDDFVASDVLIASGVVNIVGQNTYTWQISDSVAPITAIGSGWKIKVLNSAPGTPAEEVISNAFSISAGLYMSSHNTLADRCLIGNVCTINWDTAGSVSDVTLEYSDDSGSSWNLMHGGATLGSNPGFINWTVPGVLSPQIDMRYRVTDGVGGHPSASDDTDIDTRAVAEFPAANILLNPGSQPLSGRTFSVGEAITVDYTYTSTVANIDVQYTLDQDDDSLTFDNPVTILSDQPTNGDGTGQFIYTFGDLMAGGADVSKIQFRIVDSAVPDDDAANTINGVTGSFKLRGDIVITSPNDGTEKWPVGSNQTISWTHAGASITNVMIEYDDNSTFTSPTTLVAGTVSNATVGGSYNFTVNNTNFPDINVLYHNDIFIRVSDADTAIHGNSNDKSDNGHMIIGVIDFTQPSHSPTLNENWSLGIPQTITWNTQGQITSVDIYYSNSGLFNDAILINSQITSGECNPGPSCTITPDADTSVSWTPPTSSNVGVNSAIFVVDTDDNTTPQTPSYQVQGQSPIFNLHGSVTYNGTLLDGQNLKAGTQVTVTWDTFGDALNNIDIEYSRDNDLNVGTFDDPQPVVMGYDNTGGQRGTYDWTVPTTFNDDTVYLRIKPASSTAGEDISGAFKIMPNIQILTPVDQDEWEVASSQDIQWNITGTVSNITLRYSINNGANYPDGSPYEIITLDPNSGGYALTGANARYTWTVSDTITQLGKMKIQLDDDPTGDADAEMVGTFTIESLFILNQPIASNEYEVGESFNLNWDWSGTIPQIMVEISDSYDGTDPATFDTNAKCLDLSAPPCTGGLLLTNGSGSGGTGYSPPVQPVVPDWISRPSDEFPFHIRISDPNNTNTWSIAPTSATGFKIKTNLDITAPNGTEHWFVGNSDHDITWTHTGTVDNVVLEYSTDGFSSNIYCVNGGTYPSCNSVTNTNTYTWNIPDDETLVAHTCNTDTDSNPGDQIHPCMNPTVQVRVRDALDTAVLDGSDADFTARYVAKEWLLRDSVSGADLNSITMFDNSIHRIRAYSNQSVLGIVSPYTIWSPSGTNYSIGFSKTGYADFTDSAQTTTLTDQFTNAGEHFKDEEQEVFMQSTVAHNDKINTAVSYTAGLNGANDSITFKVWYSRDGLNVVTTNQAELRIYDSGNTLVLNQTSSTQNPLGSGVYTFTISPSGLSTNTNYIARNLVTLASNTQLEGFSVINITEDYSDQVIHDSAATIKPIVDANLDAQLSTQFTTLDTAVSDLETEITGKIGDTSTQTLVETLDSTRDAIEDSLEDFRTRSQDTINEMRDRIEEASIRLIIPSTVKLGETETLRLGTAENVTPTMTLLCPDGTTIFSNLSMEESTGGIYGVDITFATLDFSCAAAKAVTVIAQAVIPSNDPSDPAFTATAVGSIFLTTTDLDTIQGLAAAGLNAEKAAKDAKEAAVVLGRALQGEGSVTEAIANLQKTVGRLPSLISSNQGGVSQMRTTLNEVSDRLNVFLGNEGVDLRSLLKQEISEGVKGARNKMDRTLAATEVIRQIMENKYGDKNAPVVQTFFEIGSVKLRVIAVNPSEDKSQVVPIKIYLPKEIIPEDVIDLGQLSLGYDSGKGLYYAFNDSIELAPQETRVFEVHLEDVWRIPDEEISGTRDQTKTALKHFEGTEYYDRAKTIVDSIHTRLDEIVAKQDDNTVSREEHMGAYRVNQIVMGQIKRDIKMLEKMLQYVGAAPAIEFLKEPVPEEAESTDKIRAWYLIFGILGFIGVLALGFYLRWMLSIKASKRAPIMDTTTPDQDDDAAPFISENVEDGKKGKSGGGSIPLGGDDSEGPDSQGKSARDRNES